MKKTLTLGIAAFTICISSNLLAQTSAPTTTKDESIKAAEMLSTRPADDVKSEAPQTENKQEPVKKETKQESKTEAQPVHKTKVKESAKSDSTSGPQKMAITEQGINKSNPKPKSSAAKTTNPAPEKKK